MKKIIFFSILMLFLLASITAASASCIVPEDCDNLWNVKWFTCDYGHDNDFTLQRDGTPVCGSGNCPGFPCWGSVYTQSSYSAGELNWNIADNGSLNLWHCNDNQVYGDTYLFVISTKTIHVPRESDVGRVWLNDVDITGDGGDMNLQAGWNHLEWTSYNQNQDTSFKFNYDFASNVLLMNSEPLPPDIIVEDAEVIWNPMINDTPAELNNSINAMEPRIILEYVDSISSTWNATVKSVPDALNSSVNAIEPRIILEYVDSINATWNATVKSVPDALNSSVNAIEPRIILEYVDSINATWNATVKPVSDALNSSVNAIEPRIILEYVDSINATWSPSLVQIPFRIGFAVADAAIALKMSVRGEYDPYYDVNGDGKVTSLDALMILQIAAGRT